MIPEQNPKGLLAFLSLKVVFAVVGPATNNGCELGVCMGVSGLRAVAVFRVASKENQGQTTQIFLTHAQICKFRDQASGPPFTSCWQGKMENDKGICLKHEFSWTLLGAECFLGVGVPQT